MRYFSRLIMLSFFLGIGTALLVGGQQALSKAEESIRKSLYVSIFLQTTVSDVQAQACAEQLRKNDTAITALSYTSKAQALQDATKDPALAKSLVLLKENPFPASYIIRYADTAWLDRQDPALPLRSIPEIQDIRFDPERRSVFVSLHQWKIWLFRFNVGGVLGMLLWAFLGLFRFIKDRMPVRRLIRQVGTGVAAGMLAVGVWALMLHYLGGEAAKYQPAAFSWIPVFIAALGAMAAYAWEENAHAE